MTQLFATWDEISAVSENNPAVALARDVAGLMCRVRQQRPWQYELLTRTGAAAPGLAPIVGRFAWDRICSLFPLPSGADENVPFFGGQCPGVDYSIQIIDPDRGVVNNNIGNGTARGPIQTMRVIIGPPNFQLDTPPVPTGYTVSGVGALGAFSRSIDTKVATPRRDTRRFYFRISRIDGLPDSCGNTTPISVYPVSPPSNQITINAPIFGQERSITVNFPEFNTQNWPSFEWSPTIQFDGITAEFTTEGISIDLPDAVTLGPPVNINPVIEEINNTTNNVNTNVNNIGNAIENVTDIVTNIETILNNGTEVNLQPVIDAIKCYCGEENATYQPQNIVTGTTGGVFTLPEGTVAIVVTGNPSSNLRVRSQAGSGSSPDVYWWGHIAVCYGGADGGTRIPLQFESQSIRCGDGATSVVVSPYYELTCSVTAIVKGLNCNV